MNKDWMDALPGMPEHFDLVASHFTHGNVPFTDRGEFFRIVASALEPTGIFYDVVFNPPLSLFDHADLRKRFDTVPLNLSTFNVFNAMGVFQSAPIRDAGCIDSTEIYDWLLSNSLSEDFSRLVRGTEIVTPRGLHWDLSPDRPAEVFGYMDHFAVMSSSPPRWRRPLPKP